ncbi:hypothetical protein D3C71_1628660 [compost metagenome]
MNWPMKNTLTATMPNATGVLFINLKTLPVPEPLCDFIGGRLNNSHTQATIATGMTHKNAPRQPISAPRKLPNGAAMTVAKALPPLTIAIARVIWSSGTRRMAVAADNDQKPPIATPISARPIMNTQ